MTVFASDRRKEYAGNGVTTVFAGPRAFSASYIAVYSIDDATSEATLTTDYTLTNTGGRRATTVTMDVAPATGTTLLILRTVPFEQGTDITNQGAYRPEVVEQALDSAIQQIQQLADNDERSLRFPSTMPIADISIELPAPEASRGLIWNEDGDGLTNGELIDPALRNELASELASSGTALIGYKYPTASAANRNLRDKVSDYINAKDFGMLADGATDIRAPFEAFISERPAGAKLHFPAGEYYLAGRIDVTLASALTIDFASGARIVGDGDDVPMLTLRGGAGRHRVVVRGGHFDNGDRVFSGASQTGTALDLIDVDDFLVEGCVFGRSTRDWADNFGDTGITATRCQRGTIRDNTFYGQPDLGVYITGGALTADSDDYGDITISGNRFYRCQSGISAKRQIGRMIATGNMFYECYDGITVFEASSVDPGRLGVIAGNTFKYTQDRAIRIHAGANPAGYAITDNVIEDFGFNRALASVSSRGIALRGASGCVVANNIIRFKDWVSDANHAAIRLEQATINTVVYTPANNHVSDNLIQDVNIGIAESSAGVNHYPDNTILSATTPLSGLNTGAMGSYFDGTNRYDIVAGTARLPDGTYTPTLTNQTNVAASTAYACQYSRVGKTVSVSGKVEITCTANSVATELRLSLPIGTTFTADEQLAGTANPGDVTGAGANGAFCKAEIAGSTCRLRYTAGAAATASRTWFFHFTYRIQ